MTEKASSEIQSRLRKYDPRTEFLKEYILLCRKHDVHITLDNMPGVINKDSLVCGMNTVEGYTFSFIKHQFSTVTGRLEKIFIYSDKNKKWQAWITVDTSDDTPADWLVELQEKTESAAKPE